MGRVVVVNNVTLDGVMQAPGRPDEDLRGGFEHGGWALPYNMGDGMTPGGGALLFGRRTYEDFAAFWPHQTDGNPFAAVLDEKQKYVASTTLTEPLPWKNSTLLKGAAVAAVAALRDDPGEDLVLGSGELVASLMRHGLVDGYVLRIHPLVLGSGRRLFPDDGTCATLQLVHTVTTSTGVVIATYHASRRSSG